MQSLQHKFHCLCQQESRAALAAPRYFTYPSWGTDRSLFFSPPRQVKERELSPPLTHPLPHTRSAAFLNPLNLGTDSERVCGSVFQLFLARLEHCGRVCTSCAAAAPSDPLQILLRAQLHPFCVLFLQVASPDTDQAQTKGKPRSKYHSWQGPAVVTASEFDKQNTDLLWKLWDTTNSP